MQRKARLHDVSFGANGKQRVVFELESKADLSDLDGKDIRLEASVWREKRSLDANAYFHVLVGKIAQATSQSHTEVHNQMIADYGQMERTEFGVMSITMDNEIDWRRVEGMHLRPTGRTQVMANGRLFQAYIVMRGSHSYDSKEMSVLIDGTISEAQGLDIETVTETEKTRMLQLYGERHGN